MPEAQIEPGSDFRERVYAFVRTVPEGRVVTYGQVAQILGAPFAARAVGRALYYAPSNVPCQRVVNRWGRLAPVYGSGGMAQHKIELEDEGVEVRPDFTVDLATYQWWPDPLQDVTPGSSLEDKGAEE